MLILAETYMTCADIGWILPDKYWYWLKVTWLLLKLAESYLTNADIGWISLKFTDWCWYWLKVKTWLAGVCFNLAEVGFQVAPLLLSIHLRLWHNYNNIWSNDGEERENLNQSWVLSHPCANLQCLSLIHLKCGNVANMAITAMSRKEQTYHGHKVQNEKES